MDTITFNYDLYRDEPDLIYELMTTAILHVVQEYDINPGSLLIGATASYMTLMLHAIVECADRDMEVALQDVEQYAGQAYARICGACEAERQQLRQRHANASPPPQNTHEG